jgi:hypothetical protein
MDTTIPTEARKAGAAAIHSLGIMSDQYTQEEIALEVLAVAMPHIREQIAMDIESDRRGGRGDIFEGHDIAIRIAAHHARHGAR